MAKKTSKAYFAGGCFWGVETLYRGKEGVIGTTVGFMGGDAPDPTYNQVVAGGTGHIETIEVEYDPAVVSYEELATFFFEIHDPTQLDRQGPDVGEQYRSVAFVASKEEREIIEKLIGRLEDKGLEVVTKIEDVSDFYPAEAYHQDYYDKTGGAPYCHVYTKRF